MRRVYVALATCLLTVATTPVGAADQSGGTVVPAKPIPAKPDKPSGKVVCEKIYAIGSRIAARTFCGTPEQWAQRRSEDRQWVDKLQASPCVPQFTDTKGMPTCAAQ